MMGVLRLLVLVYQLCTIRCVVDWWCFSLLVSNQLLCPTFHTVLWWIHCRLSGKSWFGLSPVGVLSVVTHLGTSLLNACSGMTLPPAPVSTLHLSVACWLGPISAGIFTVAYASVIASLHMSDIWISSGSVSPLCPSSHSDCWCWYCETLTISTSSRW